MKQGTIQKRTSLSTRALLVSVNISQWTGRKLDRKATETANAAHKADASAGNYHKKLLPAATELEKISTLTSQARRFFYEQTLPWFNDGTRIISGKNYLPFVEEFRKIRTEFDRAVTEFETAYPRLKSEAQAKLGDLFNADEYPDNIRDRFSISLDFMPMPDAKDFRVAVSENEKREFEKKLKGIESAAIQDAANRLYSVIKSAVEKLNDPKSIFRDSMIENIGDIAALIPALNISDDSKLDELSIQAKNLIDSLDAKQVRNDPAERDRARKELAAIESSMGAFMGSIGSES